jgi:hypothetical protein
VTTDDRPPTTCELILAAGQSCVLAGLYGNVTLDPTSVGARRGRSADEMIAHLAGLAGSQVRVTVEVEVEIPSDIPDLLVRPVAETPKVARQGARRSR